MNKKLGQKFCARKHLNCRYLKETGAFEVQTLSSSKKFWIQKILLQFQGGGRGRCSAYASNAADTSQVQQKGPDAVAQGEASCPQDWPSVVVWAWLSSACVFDYTEKFGLLLLPLQEHAESTLDRLPCRHVFLPQGIAIWVLQGGKAALAHSTQCFYLCPLTTHSNSASSSYETVGTRSQCVSPEEPHYSRSLWAK